ncbi:hypothetical protein AB3N59_12160 [Leptospira sp. WS92.C1]
MKPILFLTESAIKRLFDPETIDSVFASSGLETLTSQEFYSPLKQWAEEQDAKYCIQFPDSILDRRCDQAADEQTSFRSIQALSGFSNPPFSGVPSKEFPPFVWKESLYFPYSSREKTISSFLSKIQENAESEWNRKTKKNTTSEIFQLEFEIVSETNLELKSLLNLDLPENLIEKILEKNDRQFLITPRLTGVQSIFTIYLLSQFSSKIKFNFSKVRMDVSDNKEILPILLKRSGSVITAIDFENSPKLLKNSELELNVSPYFSPSVSFLVLVSCLLDAMENFDPSDLETSTTVLFPTFSKTESWRDITEHRFAARVARHTGEEENFFQSLLKKEYEISLKTLNSKLEIVKSQLEESEIPKLLDRLKTIQESRKRIADQDPNQEEWELLEKETASFVFQAWKKRKELTTKKFDENTPAFAWKGLSEIWKS